MCYDRPHGMVGLRVLSLFDGISVGYSALIHAGFEVEMYYASEIDRFAMQVSGVNYPGIVQLGRIEDLDVRVLRGLGRIDLLLAAPPCQCFSTAGKKCGFDDPQSRLYYEFFRVLRVVNPKWFLVENVVNRQLIGALTRDLGVGPIIINSALVSAQNRSRVYFTNITGVHPPADKGIHLRDVIGEYQYIWRYPRGNGNRTKLDGIQKCPTLTASNWKANYKIYRSGERESFTAEYAECLQTLPMGYTSSVSDKQRFRLLGNAWTLEVICHILSALEQ